MTDRRVVQCRSPFAVNNGSERLIVSSGDLYWADDRVVEGREHLFEDVNVKSTGDRRGSSTSVTGSAVETADAAPNARRRMGRPPKVDPTPEVVNPVSEV